MFFVSQLWWFANAKDTKKAAVAVGEKGFA
jgi:hypothetical protein